MNVLEGFGYMTMWGIGFIAVEALTYPFFMQAQNFLAGNGRGA